MHVSWPEPEYVPASQSVHEDAVVLDHVPPSHLEHALLPSSSEYLPASHDVHAEDELPLYQPARHVEPGWARGGGWGGGGGEAKASEFAPLRAHHHHHHHHHHRSFTLPDSQFSASPSL